jgi:hypothetical protein
LNSERNRIVVNVAFSRQPMDKVSGADVRRLLISFFSRPDSRSACLPVVVITFQVFVFIKSLPRFMAEEQLRCSRRWLPHYTHEAIHRLHQL